MNVVNSYVFIEKKDNIKKTKEIILGANFISIFSKIFDINIEENEMNEMTNNTKRFIKENIDLHNTVLRGKFNYKINESKTVTLNFKLVSVTGVYYLDIFLKDKKSNIINALNDINQILLNDKDINKKYIPVVSYDFVSQNFCNRIFPLLNEYERKLRKLMFLTFTSRFKELYFEKTASDDMITNVKGKIKEGKSDTKRIQNYFYSMDMATVREFLFYKSWTDIEEKRKNSILKKDFSKMSNEKIRNLIDSISPKSNWERYFSDKGFDDEIESTMYRINILRNKVAHNKLFSKEEYDEMLILLNNTIKIIDKAIIKTETLDFSKINYSSRLESIINMQKKFIEFFNDVPINYFKYNFLEDNYFKIYKSFFKEK